MAGRNDSKRKAPRKKDPKLKVDYLSLPQGANPEDDPIVGQDESGSLIKRTFLGVDYKIKPSEVKSWKSKAGTVDRAKEVAKETVTGFLEGVKSGVSAPARALSGEPVTNSDALATATLGGASGSLGKAPKGSLRSMASRDTDTKWFSEDALRTAANQNDKSREILVYMPIDDFLKAAEKDFSSEKLSNTKKLISEGRPFDSVPTLSFKNNADGTGKVTGHDGRHRALALKEKGETTIPVRLISQGGDGPGIRWGQQNNPESFDYVDVIPQKLIEQDGDDLVDMPEKAANIRPDSNSTKETSKYAEGGAVPMEKRPKSRPKAPIVSKRPKSRDDKPDPKSEENNWEELGDLELRADLEELLKKDPIARLGYDPKVIDYGMKGNNAYYDPNTDKVEYGQRYGSSKAAITHEFRHRGIKKLRGIIQDNPEYFIDNFGEEAVDVVLDMKEEKLVETYDHVKDKFVRGLDEEGKPREEDIKHTVNERNPHYLDKLQKAFDESKAIFWGESEAEAEKWPNLHTNMTAPTAILRMAEQVLRDTGEIGQKPVGSTGTGKYNKGGAVSMEKQMSLFEEGGMADDGMEVDPVSGNEIPPGSQAEEVRDDVDAKLSSGEYVVPADVVQYFGLKFFENLRSEAKGDLEEMNKEGRIGGQPSGEAGMGGEEELSPEEMAMLQEIMGGDQGAPMQMAEGGTVETPKTPTLPQSTFKPADWSTVGGSYSPSQGLSANPGRATYKTYVGPSGESRLILFVGGKPNTPIPEGFTLKETAAEKQQEKTPEEIAAEEKELMELANRGPAEEGKSDPEEGKESVSVEDMNPNELAEAYGKMNSTGVNVALAAASAVGGIFGKGLNALANNYKGDIEDRAKELGVDLSTVNPDLDLSLENFTSDEAFNDAMSSVAGRDMSYDSGSGSYKSTTETTAPTTSSRPPDTKPGTTPTATPATGASDSESSPSSSPSGEDETGGGQYAKGGLVKKRATKKTTAKKTPTKKKGLASK